MSQLRFATAREVFNAFPEAKDNMTAEPTAEPPPIFMRALAASETPEDALTFCAYALGRREAVWWACQCIRLIGAAEQDPCLGAAETWVREPDEERRRAALKVGMESDRRTPEPWLALAAGWSGGSMSPVEGSNVPPPGHLTASAARAAILIALARVGAKERGGRLSACVEGGLQLMDPGMAGPR